MKADDYHCKDDCKMSKVENIEVVAPDTWKSSNGYSDHDEESHQTGEYERRSPNLQRAMVSRPNLMVIISRIEHWVDLTQSGRQRMENRYPRHVEEAVDQYYN